MLYTKTLLFHVPTVIAEVPGAIGGGSRKSTRKQAPGEREDHPAPRRTQVASQRSEGQPAPTWSFGSRHATTTTGTVKKMR